MLPERNDRTAKSVLGVPLTSLLLEINNATGILKALRNPAVSKRRGNKMKGGREGGGVGEEGKGGERRRKRRKRGRRGMEKDRKGRRGRRKKGKKKKEKRGEGGRGRGRNKTSLILFSSLFLKLFFP